MEFLRIPVQDTRRSAAFYAELLGTSPLIHSKGDYAEVETEDLLLALYGPDFEDYDRRTPELDRPHQTIPLPTMPTTHLHQVLEHHGIPQASGGTVHDPDGHILTILPATDDMAPSQTQ